MKVIHKWPLGPPRYDTEVFGWPMLEVVEMMPPVHAIGKQGFWRFDL